jgi:hypothetical protein
VQAHIYDTYVDAGLAEVAHQPQGQLVVGFLVGVVIGDLEDEARVAVATTTAASSCGPLVFVVVEEQPQSGQRRATRDTRLS